MMMHCLHFDRTMLLCRRVGVPPKVSSLADELLYWSVDHYNNVQMLVERKGGCHVARWQESVNITDYSQSNKNILKLITRRTKAR